MYQSILPKLSDTKTELLIDQDPKTEDLWKASSEKLMEKVHCFCIFFSISISIFGFVLSFKIIPKISHQRDNLFWKLRFLLSFSSVFGEKLKC